MTHPTLLWLYREVGLSSLSETGRDAYLIILARTLRMFAYGANSVFIALFFAALGFSDLRIGLFMTLTLLGDVILTLGLTLIADSLGRRRILLLGSGMMIISGLAFVWSENYWLLLLAAVVGIISASGGDFGPFRAVEESILSHLTTATTRNNVLAWYVTSASLGSAIGTELGGRTVHWLTSRGRTDVQAYHAVFALYIFAGVINALSVLLLSDRTEAEHKVEKVDVLLDDMEEQENGEDQRERPSSQIVEPTKSESTSHFASISTTTKSVMYKLWPLLIVDSIADGMVNYSLTTYYLDQKFHVSASTLGDVTSISYFLAAISTIFAGPLANHLGLVNTMVFTHIPSSAAVLLFPLPASLFWTIALLFVRTGLNNMDQAPRAAFIAAVVAPDERTAVNGITSMLRTLAATAGPSITGGLAGNDRFWIAFVAAGALRLAYDFGLWALFIGMNIDEYKSRRGG